MGPEEFDLFINGTFFSISPYRNSQIAEVVLSTEYGRSSSPRIRFIKLLFPEPVSPGMQ